MTSDEQKRNAALLSSCATKWQQFDDLIAQLNVELSNIEVQIDCLKNKDGSELFESVEMDSLEQLLNHLTSHEPLLNRLVGCSTELCSLLGELSQEEQLHQTHSDTVVMRERYQANWDLIVHEKQQLIGSIRSQLKSLNQWIDSGKIRLKEGTEPVSLDEEKLHGQFKTIDTLQTEAQERRKRISELLDKYRKNRPSSEVKKAAHAEEDEHGLLKRFEEFDAQINEKRNRFDSLAKNLRNIYSNVDSLNNWISESMASMKENEMNHVEDRNGVRGAGDADQIVEVIENLHHEKKLKKAELIQVKKLAKEVLDGSGTTQDEGQLAESLINVHANYHDFTDQIAKTVANIVSSFLMNLKEFLLCLLGLMSAG